MDTNTIVAIATPPGFGALGVIRISGIESIAIATKLFEGKKLQEQSGQTLHFGRIRNMKGELLDEVLVSVFRTPHSYTGEDVIEISCHGSPFILQEILQTLVDAGAKLAKPGEFTLRAFLNGKLDLSQAEAVADLIASESKAAHDIALNQLKGGIKNQIQLLRLELLNFISLIELELDFGEEDVQFADRSKLRNLLKEILFEIQKLNGSFHLGNAVKNGIITVIAGRPNAGKSTLLNALLNEERAIVSEIAGTTRDTIEEKLNIQGVLFRLIDTAGIREAQDQIEALGVQRTMEKIAESSVLIYVFDVIKTSKIELHRDLQSLIKPGQPFLVLANKMDLNPTMDYETFTDINLDKENIIPCSAKNAINIEYLKNRLYQVAIGNQSISTDLIVVNARHQDALNKAAQNLQEAISGIETNLQTDLLAQSIRQALYNLSEISGEITNDEILGNIFGKFCIGK